MQLIGLHVELKKDILFTDKFKEASVFRHLQAVPGHKVIIGKEEVSRFFEQERVIQLLNSSTWVYTRWDQSTQQVLCCPGVSLSGHSQPNRVFSIVY